MTITINSRHISIIEIKMAMSGIRKFLDANFLHGGQVDGRARNPGLGLLSSVYTHMEHSDSNLLQTARLGTPRSNDYDAMFKSSITELVNFACVTVVISCLSSGRQRNNYLRGLAIQLIVLNSRL